MVLVECVPGLRLRSLQTGNHIGGEEGLGTVVPGAIAGGVEPAVSCEVFADFVFEIDLFMETAHATASLVTRPRTSILPVTAAEMRAVRRSWRRAMALSASAMRASSLAVSSSRNRTMA